MHYAIISQYIKDLLEYIKIPCIHFRNVNEFIKKKNHYELVQENFSFSTCVANVSSIQTLGRTTPNIFTKP